MKTFSGVFMQGQASPWQRQWVRYNVSGPAAQVETDSGYVWVRTERGSARLADVNQNGGIHFQMNIYR